MAISKRELEEIIDIAVQRAIQAGAAQASASAKDAFKATERRLYALPIMFKKLKTDSENLEEMKAVGLKQRSKDIVRFNRSGYRVDPEDLAAAIEQNLEATIAQTQHEIDTMRIAMETFKHDPYYATVTGKYIDRYDDEDIAEDLGCSSTQVWKQRTRIVKDISVLLYGVSAI